jgi:hypothetical protein
MIDSPAIEDARERLPDRGEVPEEAQEALEQPEGPLAGENDHPTGEDILKPSSRDTLVRVAEHATVSDLDDVADVLSADRNIVERAFDIHEIEKPEGEDTDYSEDVVSLPLHGEVNLENVRDPVYTDGRLLEHLVVQCGYGVEDIRTVLEQEMNQGRPSEKSRWRVRTQAIEAALQDIGLMERDETEPSTEENEDIRLGGATHDFSETENSSSGGLTINTRDFE